MNQYLDFQAAVFRVQAGESVHKAAKALLDQLSEQEKLSLLQGNPSFWEGFSGLFAGVYTKNPYSHSEIKRLGIPGVQYCDGPRGVNIHQGTVFPCSMARGATWDPALEEKVALAIGREARAYGANTVGSVCINLPRHPAWGRVQETYSEDPLLLGQFGVAHVHGLQKNVMACVKHFALNSMETARFRVNVSIDDAALHEVFLPHFKRCVEAGAFSVMTAYNSVNGEWAGESQALILDILRKKWHYDGIIITDWLFGLRDGVKSVKADLDIEAPFRNRRHASLEPALVSGEISWSDIDRIGMRIIRNQLKFYATRSTVEPTKDVVCSKEHRGLAKMTATRAIVLLKNGQIDGKPLLPLSSDLKSCAVIGRHANSALTGDRASSWVHCPEIIPPYQGIKEQLPGASIRLSASDNEQDAVTIAKNSEVAIVIVGYDGNDEGEFLKPSLEFDAEALALLPKTDDSPEAKIVQAGRAKAAAAENRPNPGTARRPEDDLASRPTGGDRTSVRLRPEDVRLIRAVTAANPRTVVSMVTAGAIIIEEWHHLTPSILVSWYNGCENGRALADILVGNANPSGRLPWSMPRTEAHLPPFDADVNEVTYDKWFGQRMLDKMGVQASYPLGYGLSYTRFELEGAKLNKVQQDKISDITVTVAVKNTGSISGWCVVQIYGVPDLGPGPHDFPNRLLAGFKAEEVEAGRERWIQVQVSLEPFRRWINGKFATNAESITFEIGQYAGDPCSLLCKYSDVKAHL
ncbi:glycoside hydrolase superfamily [Cadophora sp. MPI-SDFR-AT-0126]|nr:glycoside hydrolase superfamily [Leotiomycetes sp. MPI-SDFR-AT-0126]